jgi:hypothetical protein
MLLRIWDKLVSEAEVIPLGRCLCERSLEVVRSISQNLSPREIFLRQGQLQDGQQALWTVHPFSRFVWDYDYQPQLTISDSFPCVTLLPPFKVSL